MKIDIKDKFCSDKGLKCLKCQFFLVIMVIWGIVSLFYYHVLGIDGCLIVLSSLCFMSSVSFTI